MKSELNQKLGVIRLIKTVGKLNRDGSDLL